MKQLLPFCLLLASCSTDKTQPAPDPGPATYRVRFEATWSAGTHPQDFPAGAHFSQLIGASHARIAGYSSNGSPLSVLFQPGDLASPGIRNMAEIGNNTVLRTELGRRGNLVLGELLESRATFATSPGELIDTVTVDARHPLLSAVTMIAPSPDWFVALHEQSLLDEQGNWRQHLMVPARTYDAGTDSGPSFNSPDQPTTPAQPIQLITNGPLARSGTVPPLGVFHLDRIR